MHDLRDHDGLSREQFIIRMAKALEGVENVYSAPQRLDAYEAAGFFGEEIPAYDLECQRREVIRRSIGNLKDKRQCLKESQSASL